MESKEYFEQIYEKNCEELRSQLSEVELIYIDSCSLMDPNMPLFTEHIIPVLEAQHKKLIIIENVLNEVKRISRPVKDAKKLGASILAYMGMYCLRFFADRPGGSLLEYQRVPEDVKNNHADAAFEAVLGMKSISNRIMVVTQDSELMKAVLRLNESGATNRKPIKVYKISDMERAGFLVLRKNNAQDHQHTPQRIAQNRFGFPTQNRNAKQGNTSVPKPKPVPKPQQPMRRPASSAAPMSAPQQSVVQTQGAPAPVPQPIPAPMKAWQQAQCGTPQEQLKTAEAKCYLKDTELLVPPKFLAISRVQLPEITAAYLPETVKILMPQAFIDCGKLTRVALPNSLETIEESAFHRCVSLQSITIPQRVTRIDSAAFKDCASLASITLGTGLRELGSSVFANCVALSSITIPSTVKRIETMAFKGCKSLRTLNLSEGLEFIGASAFCNCVSLEHLVIPKSVNEIATTAFTACHNLTLCCYKDSYALRFAIENKMKYQIL